MTRVWVSAESYNKNGCSFGGSIWTLADRCIAGLYCTQLGCHLFFGLASLHPRQPFCGVDRENGVDWGGKSESLPAFHWYFGFLTGSRSRKVQQDLSESCTMWSGTSVPADTDGQTQAQRTVGHSRSFINGEMWGSWPQGRRAALTPYRPKSSTAPHCSPAAIDPPSATGWMEAFWF